MPARIDCEGAPRDLGLAQGRACRSAVRDYVTRNGLSSRRRPLALLGPLASGRVLSRSPGRDIVRHYPHLAERIAGLARGAGLTLEVLVELLEGSAQLEASAAVSLAADRPEAISLDVRIPRASSGPGARWVLRNSRPTVGYASVELTLPWFASSLAGVNAEGLGVAIVANRSDGAAGDRDRAGPTVLLLVQECLQRFADVEAGLDWCMKRPAWGGGCVVLADAAGELAAVEFDPAGRRVVRGSDGMWMRGLSAERAAELRKLVGRRSAVDASERLAFERADAEGCAWVRLAPARRQLSFEDPGGGSVELEVA